MCCMFSCPVAFYTPVIIKYPFWQMTAKNPGPAYICLNKGQAFCPQKIECRSICIDADIAEVLTKLTADVRA